MMNSGVICRSSFQSTVLMQSKEYHVEYLGVGECKLFEVRNVKKSLYAIVLNGY